MPLSPKNKKTLIAARACVLSYMDFESDAFRLQAEEWGFEYVETSVTADIELFCAVHGDDVWICPMGTRSVADWIMNLFFKKCPINGVEGGMVHHGFMIQAQALMHFISRYLSKVQQGREVNFCGHSLGASIATILAWDYRERSPAAVILFGSPRTGNKAFVDAFNNLFGSRTVRLTNNNDPVPWVPFKWMGFAHVFHRHHFDHNGKLYVFYRPTRGQKWRECILGRLQALKKVELFDGITDHNMPLDYYRLVLQQFPGEDKGGYYENVTPRFRKS